MADPKPRKQYDGRAFGLSSPPLRDITEACFALFKSIISTAANEKPEISTHPDSSVTSSSRSKIQGLHDSFARWVDYTDAEAPTHIFLDNQGRTDVDIPEMVRVLLKMIERNLRRLGRKDNPEAAVPAINTALQRLHLLSRSIRKASIRKQDQIALSSNDDDDGGGGGDDFRKLAAAFVGWTFPNASPSLCEHIGYTIEARRRVLQSNIQREDSRVQKRSEFSRKAETSSVAPREIPKTSSASQSAHRPSVQSVASTQLTQQSGLDVETFRFFATVARSKNPDLATPIIHRKQGEVSGAMAAGYPDPPKVRPGDVSVPCPFCKEALSAAQIRREKSKESTFWRRHVEDHLQPYGCLFWQCAHVWFTREADWTEHMNTVHAANWPRIVHTMTWYCDLSHDSATDDVPKTFVTETAWREHMMNVELHPEHSDQPTHAQLETLSIQKRKLAPREKGSCPFCADTPEEIHKSTTSTSLDNDPRLLRHICKHIHYLSFFALRFLNNPVPEDEQISVGSKVSELAIASEGAEGLADVLLAPFDVDDINVCSSATNHTYREEMHYINEDLESAERDPFTTIRQDIPDYGQEDASWDFLPVREIIPRADDEVLKTWGATTSTQMASTYLSDGHTNGYFWNSLTVDTDALSNVSNTGDLSVTGRKYLDPEYSSYQYPRALELDDDSCSWGFLPQKEFLFTSIDDDLKNWNSHRHLARPHGRDDFRIALICALPMLYDTAALLLDRSYADEGFDYGRAPGDHNRHITGCISGHHAVVSTGSYIGASQVEGLQTSFQSLKLVFIVGSCGGVPVIPHTSPEKRNLFLGDVIISTQVLQFDLGKENAQIFQITTDDLPEPRSRAIHELLQNESKSETLWASFVSKSMEHLKELQQKAVDESSMTDYERPILSSDVLFVPEVNHSHNKDCAVCADGTGKACSTALLSSCEDLGCGKTKTMANKRSVISRSRQNVSEGRDLRVLYGRIGTSDQVIKSSVWRDKLAAEYELMAFGMEGPRPSALEDLPYIVVSGVCDYSDGHRHKEWQPFAAAAAAAAVKALLQTYRLDGADMMTEDTPTTGVVPKPRSASGKRIMVKQDDIHK